MNWYLFLYNPIFPAKSAGFMKLQQSENNSETWAWEAEQNSRNHRRDRTGGRRFYAEILQTLRKYKIIINWKNRY
jgi:hypothetical protein